jgi:hypothetical protein
LIIHQIRFGRTDVTHRFKGQRRESGRERTPTDVARKKMEFRNAAPRLVVVLVPPTTRMQMCKGE